ncbi:MAG: hypothetical protein COA82_02990 [Alkaliphilus sp.]|nr:MAG: hypothetical protein COA82_02990 [Alkaliphilus sp.]
MFDNTPQQLAEKKLVLLYILHKLDSSVVLSTFTDFILENEIINYFEFQQLLDELSDTGFVNISKEKTPEIQITGEGINSLNYLINLVTKQQSISIDSLLDNQKHKLLMKVEYKSVYSKADENCFKISLLKVENEIVTFSLEMSVHNKKEAIKLCVNWENNAERLHSSIYNLLLKSK